MSDTGHPWLPPSTPLLAVGEGVQVGGADTCEGVLVDPAEPWVTGLLRGLDGSRSQRAVLAEAAGAGLDPTAVRALLDALRGTGLLADVDPADLLAADAGPAAQARTRAELPAALAAGAAAPWAGRRAAAVVVEGATRVGVPLAAVLAASGVGRVSVRDPGATAAGDVVVGGLGAADEGRPRTLAAADAVRRASPLTDLRPLPDGVAPDLVVLARPWAASDPLAAAAHVDGTPHLVATVRDQTGVVGPLVVPGRSSCLRCADLHRRDADPRWPAVAAQLTAAEAPAAGSTLVCLLTAVTAAAQVLAHLDGTAAPVTLGATLEIRPPQLLPLLRAWPPHPACGCGAGRGTADLPCPSDAAPSPTGGARWVQGTLSR